MGQPVPRHDLQTTPEAGLDKNARLGIDMAPVVRPRPERSHIEAPWGTPVADQTVAQDGPHAGLYFRPAPSEVFEDAVLEDDYLAALHRQLVRIS